MFTNDFELILASHNGNIDFFTLELAVQGSDISLFDLLFRELNMRLSRVSRQLSGCLSGVIFPLLPTFNNNYYHWVVEYLPQLRMLELYERRASIQPKILIREDSPSFVRESLSLLGYGSDRYEEWKGGDRVIETLITTNRRFHEPQLGYHHSIDDYNWLRNKAQRRMQGLGRRESHSRLFISRQNADKERNVRNYEKLMSELEQRGFKSVVLESLPFKQQVRLFMEADAILGPHGAGLAKLVFADEVQIFELLPETRLRPDFYLLADVMGHDYRCMVSPTDEGGNMTIDIETLRERLNEMGLTRI